MKSQSGDLSEPFGVAFRSNGRGTAAGNEASTPRQPSLTPGTLIVIGLGGVIALNIIAFVANVFVALLRLGSAKEEKDVEERMVPALQGVPSELGPRFVRAVAVGLWVFMGVAAASAVWLVGRWLRSAP